MGEGDKKILESSESKGIRSCADLKNVGVSSKSNHVDCLVLSHTWFGKFELISLFTRVKVKGGDWRRLIRPMGGEALHIFDEDSFYPF